MENFQKLRVNGHGKWQIQRKWIRFAKVCLTAAVLSFIFCMTARWLFPAWLTPIPDPAQTDDRPSISDATGLRQPAKNDFTDAPDWVSKDYLTPNEYSRPQDPLETVNGVVIHYVGNPGTSAEQNRSYFEGLAYSGYTYASSHFVIGIDGTIIQCIPLNEISYCSNHRNNDTVAIECCHPDDSGKFTPETMASLTKLTQWLCDTYDLNTKTDVIRHYDVTGKICPKYYVENEDAWQIFLDTLMPQMAQTNE